MNTFLAIQLIEGDVQPDMPIFDEDQIVEAWQHLVDTGVVWELQGWYGRMASGMINDGILTAGAGT